MTMLISWIIQLKTPRIFMKCRQLAAQMTVSIIWYQEIPPQKKKHGQSPSFYSISWSSRPSYAGGVDLFHKATRATVITAMEDNTAPHVAIDIRGRLAPGGDQSSCGSSGSSGPWKVTTSMLSERYVCTLSSCILICSNNCMMYRNSKKNHMYNMYDPTSNTILQNRYCTSIKICDVRVCMCLCACGELQKFHQWF